MPSYGPTSGILSTLSPGARRAMALRVVGAAVACALALLAAINPMLGLSAAMIVLVAVAFTQNSTFGVCAFVFFSYFDVLTQFSGAALSPVKVTGGALIVLAIVELAARTRRERGAAGAAPAWFRHPVVLFGMFAFVAIGMVSAQWATNMAQVSTLSQRLTLSALAFLAIGVFLRHRSQLHALACTALWAGVLATVAGPLLGREDGAGRALGTFDDPNEFAAAMVVSIALGFGAFGAAATTWGRRACVAGILVCGQGLLASQSRGGLVAVLVVAVVVVVSSRGNERVRMMGAASVLVAAVLALLLLTPAGNQTLTRITEGDTSGRSDLWRIAQLQFADEPLHGVGLGNYPAVASRYITSETEHTELVNNGAPRTTHNSYLEIAAELGVLGLTAFGLFVGGSLLLLMRALKVARRLRDAGTVSLGRGVLAATIGMLANCIFLSNHYDELLWVLLATCVAYNAMVASMLRDAARVRVEQELAVATLDSELVDELPAPRAAYELDAVTHSA